MGVLRVVGLLGSLLLLASGAAYVLKTSPLQRLPDPQPTAASVEEVSELDRAKAADLAASLTIQERAEEKQQLEAAEAEHQRVAAQAALAARAQEEAARDRALQEAVTKSE
jgi:hypothetical protein